MSTYRLSIEEVGFLMGYLGEREAAAGYLTGLLGQQNSDNLSGRIVAASHGLVARDILTVGEAATDTSIDSTVAGLIQSMISAHSSIRCEKMVGNDSELITIFLHQDKHVAHHISSEVVVNLEDVSASQRIQQLILDFVDAPVQGDPQAVGSMPLTELEDIRNTLIDIDENSLEARFSTNIPASTARELAAALKGEPIEWGSVIRLETATTGQATPLEANAGILYARTQKGLWLFDIDSDSGNRSDTHVKIYHGNQPIISQLIAKLF